MAVSWRSVDHGWAQESTPWLRCDVRAALPWLESFVNCCGCGPQAPWRPARVGIFIAPESRELVLRCEGDDAGEAVFRLGLLRSLRRLGSRPPSMEMCFLGLRPRLQLQAPETSEKPAEVIWPRFQLFHAFLACLAETLQDRVRMDAVEWPLQGGRRASLVHLAQRLRGVTTTTPKELQAPFADTCCPLCLEPWETMPQEHSVVVLTCGHAFCEVCLSKHVEAMQDNCPSCRRSFGPAEKKPEISAN